MGEVRCAKNATALKAWIGNAEIEKELAKFN